MLQTFVQFLRVQCVRHWLACTLGGVLSFTVGFILWDTNLAGFTLSRPLIDGSYDLLFRYRTTIIQPDVALVFLDEPSREQLQQRADAPWDRGLHARLLDRLTREGARLAVFDMVFTGTSNPDADDALAAAIARNGNVILGTEWIPQEHAAAEGGSWVRPFEPFANSALGVGNVMFPVDENRTVRQHFHGSESVDPPSLSWLAATVAGVSVTASAEERFSERWFNFYGPPGAAFPHSISYARAIATNDLAKGFFRGKYVFIGARQSTGFTGSGLDEFKSPYPGGSGLRRLYYPGVELHATSFLNLLRADWLQRFPPFAEFLLIGSFGLLFGYLLTAARVPWAISIAVLTLAAVFGIALLLFIEIQLWFAWLIVWCQIATALVWSVGFNSVQLYVQKRLLHHSLALHLSPGRVKQLLATPGLLLRPGAEKQVITVFFTDIENFTSVSETMDSDELAQMMNGYFETAVSKCIHPTDGTVVKFIGDAIFAFWNAPLPQPDHQRRACQAALLLGQHALKFHAANKPLFLRTRVGIHTGSANVGNFGSVARIDYTAIGESVNLASRLEGLNKYLRTNILLTDETLQAVAGEFVTRCVGRFRLKGFGRLVQVHELLGSAQTQGASRPWLEIFNEGLVAFSKANFAEAAQLFERTIKMRGEDGPSRFLLEQIQHLKSHPLPPDWQGEIGMDEK